MSEFVVITEEQAQQFEAAGIPVQIQYTVRLDDLKLRHPVAPGGKAAKPTRAVISTKARLRWTNVKYTGNAGTQAALGFQLLAEYFSRHPDAKPERHQVNTYLTKEMMKKGEVFSASIVTNLIANKYLEVCDG